MQLNDIWGNDIAKRAVEVAAAGQHSITFIGNDEAELFRQYCQEHNIEAYAVPPCPCGNLGDPLRKCTCEKSASVAHRRKIAARQADLMVETHRCKASNLKRAKLPTSLAADTLGFLNAAIDRFGLGQVEVLGVLRAAQTIATLSKDTVIRPTYLAEALQYRCFDENN